VFREVVKASTGKKPVVLILKDNKISEYEIREDTDEMLGTLEIAIE
jgi:DTW domain-containing protein YfiP